MNSLRTQPQSEVEAHMGCRGRGVSMRDDLKQVRTLVADGLTLPKALNAVVDPWAHYDHWSPLWDVLHDAQQGPKHTLADFAETHSQAEVFGLIDRALAVV
jgi:hypothetical protein